ncbi:MAG TPA: 4'-phosphopantetheinyl transferase superfamily protein [Casimicrobiaceae bacterium]|nr:4'-phosphopantetheinyl transferase superfamily protein [Casimicrobiaceae bacterium]
MNDSRNPCELPSPVASVRLWWCSLHAAGSDLESYEAILSDDERRRAARFGMALLRDRYIVGRVALRRVLGMMLGVAAADVRIVRGTRGRPHVKDAVGIDFNVSHTGDLGLVGVSMDARIGVDVERRDRQINVDGIARKFLTTNEREAIERLDDDARRQHVLTLWTCKEAMSKATGDALSAPFASIDVDLRQGPHLRAGPAKYAAAAWTLHRAEVPDDHVATIALWRA